MWTSFVQFQPRAATLSRTRRNQHDPDTSRDGGSVPAGTRFGFNRARGRPPGLEPAAGKAAYAVSKAALVHLTRVLDLELRPLGIRVNAVAPQLLDTAKDHPYLTPELLAHAVSPAAVAGIIISLVSDAAAPVSGAIVPACGAA